MRADSFYSEIGREDPKGNVVRCPVQFCLPYTPAVHRTVRFAKSLLSRFKFYLSFYFKGN